MVKLIDMFGGIRISFYPVLRLHNILKLCKRKDTQNVIEKISSNKFTFILKKFPIRL